jgi:hypothetical protein
MVEMVKTGQQVMKARMDHLVMLVNLEQMEEVSHV